MAANSISLDIDERTQTEAAAILNESGLSISDHSAFGMYADREDMKDPWLLFRKSITEFSDDFFEDGRNQPDMQTRETIF